MTNAAAVGVIDHKTHIPMLGARSRILIVNAAPTDRSSTKTEKMAAFWVSVSFVNISWNPSPRTPFGGNIPARWQAVARVAGPDLGGGQVAVLRLRARLRPHATLVA
jgi:hypothetical protein